jgi:hypothetical protein
VAFSQPQIEGPFQGIGGGLPSRDRVSPPYFMMCCCNVSPWMRLFYCTAVGYNGPNTSQLNEIRTQMELVIVFFPLLGLMYFRLVILTCCDKTVMFLFIIGGFIIVYQLLVPVIQYILVRENTTVCDLTLI